MTTQEDHKSLLQAHGWEPADAKWHHHSYCDEDEFVSEHLALKILWLHQDRDTQEGEKNKYKDAVEKKVTAVRHYKLQHDQLKQRIGQAITFWNGGEHSKAKRVLVQSMSIKNVK